MYSGPGAAVINDHTLSGLKHTCVVSQAPGPEAWDAGVGRVGSITKLWGRVCSVPAGGGCQPSLVFPGLWTRRSALSACVSQGRGLMSAASVSSSSASASLRLFPDTVPFALAAALFDSGFWLHLLFSPRPGSPLWHRVFRDLLQRELELDVGLLWLPSVTMKHRRGDLGLGLLAILKSWFFRLLHGLPREPPNGRIVEQVVSLIPTPIKFRAGRRLMECLGPCDCGNCWAWELQGPLGGWREHGAGWMRDAVKAYPPPPRAQQSNSSRWEEATGTWLRDHLPLLFHHCWVPPALRRPVSQPKWS